MIQLHSRFQTTANVGIQIWQQILKKRDITTSHVIGTNSDFPTRNVLEGPLDVRCSIWQDGTENQDVVTVLRTEHLWLSCLVNKQEEVLMSPACVSRQVDKVLFPLP